MSKSISCFLIDDDKDDQEVFQIALHETGIHVNCVIADDGHAALNILNADINFIPDFIFLDLNMPRINGKQFLIMVKDIARLKNVPIIVYTTSSRPHHKEEVFKLGATGFITKPSEISELIKQLKKIFVSNREASS